MRSKSVIMGLSLMASVGCLTSQAATTEQLPMSDAWDANAPLIANELQLWRVTDTQREIYDQQGRWLKARLSAATKGKTSISPLSEAIQVFANRYMHKPFTKSFNDLAVPVPPEFSSLQTDTLGATPGTQESIDLIKGCVKHGSKAQAVVCHAMAAALAAEWTRPSNKEIQLSGKEIFGESKNLITIMDIVGSKVDLNSQKEGVEVLDPLAPQDQSVIDRSLSVVTTKKALLKAESYLSMMVPVRYE